MIGYSADDGGYNYESVQGEGETTIDIDSDKREEFLADICTSDNNEPIKIQLLNRGEVVYENESGVSEDTVCAYIPAIG